MSDGRLTAAPPPPRPVVVAPGSSEVAVLQHVVDGLHIALALERPQGTVIVPARIGSLAIAPAHLRAVQEHLLDALPVGQPVVVTWLAVPDGGLAAVSLASACAAERTPVALGLATPSPLAWAHPRIAAGLAAPRTGTAASAWATDLTLAPVLVVAALAVAAARVLRGDPPRWARLGVVAAALMPVCRLTGERTRAR